MRSHANWLNHLQTCIGVLVLVWRWQADSVNIVQLNADVIFVAVVPRVRRRTWLVTLGGRLQLLFADVSRGLCGGLFGSLASRQCRLALIAEPCHRGTRKGAPD